MPKRKAPAPASDWEATEQGADATTNHSRTKRDTTYEPRGNSEESPESREKAARDGDNREETAINRAERIAKEADTWVDEHPDVWIFATDLCLKEARAKRRVSMQFASEVIRKKDFASFKRYGAGINNKLRPALARRLVREHPEVKPYIELRRSALDLLDQEEGRFPDD